MGLLSGKSELAATETGPESVEYDPHGPGLCNRIAELLRLCDDPDAPYMPAAGEARPKLGVRNVKAVFQEDERGLVEVLYLAYVGPRYINGKEQPGEPMTAFLRGRELAYITEGW